MRSILSDLRYTIRQLLKSPGFTITTIIIIGLTIGANTAIFSVVDAVLLQSLPYPDPGKLVAISENDRTHAQFAVAYPNYLDWRANQHAFEDLSAYRRDDLSLTGSGEPERVRGAFVTASYFRVLGVAPTLGRVFGDEDDRKGGANVCLVSENFWRNRFGTDPKIIGRTLVLNGVTYEVIGVAPRELVSPENVDIYLPFGFYADQIYLTNRGTHPGIRCIGRLKPGVSIEQAKTDLAVIAHNLETRYPETNDGAGIGLTALLDATIQKYRVALSLLLAVTGFVLLIGCANVANLLLGKAATRQRELTLRAALGASRGRIIWQLLAESILLAVSGGIVGLLLASWSKDLIVSVAPHDSLRFQEIHLNGFVLLFAASVTLGSGLLFGMWPAWKVSRIDLSAALEDAGSRGSTGGVGRQRSQGWLVISQVALASLLLICAGLLIQSFQSLQGARLGFNPEHLLSVSIKLPDPRQLSETADPKEVAKMAAFYSSLLQAIQNLPGVEMTALNTSPPFGGSDRVKSFGVLGRPDPGPGKEPTAEFACISPDCFRVLGIPLHRGRSFTLQDSIERTPVVIIDEGFVNQLFAGQDPLGQQIFDDLDSGQGIKYTVVGVVGSVRHNDPGEAPKYPQLYLPILQVPEPEATILLRTTADPASLVSAVRKTVQSVDPDLPIFNIRTIEDQLATSLATQRLSVILISLFSVLALVLAAVGLYGVLAYSISQRTREFGIRMALGAQSQNILGSVLRQGLTIVGIGLGLGIACSLVLTRLIRSMLYGVSGTDPIALLTAVVVLGLAAFLACLLPALRALRIDPITALRE